MRLVETLYSNELICIPLDIGHVKLDYGESQLIGLKDQNSKLI